MRFGRGCISTYDLFNLSIPHLTRLYHYEKILAHYLRLIPALILAQTLYFKFSAASKSVYIFETLVLEPLGRIGIAWIGATVISGAIVSHLTLLGIEVQGDGGYLFFLALVVFVTSAAVLWMERKNIPVIGFRF
jgi:hypothetical protein